MQITVTVATLALQLPQVKPGSCHSVVPLEPPGCKTLDVVLVDGRYHLIQVEAAPPRHRKLQVVAVSDHQLPMLVAPAPRKCHDLPLIAAAPVTSPSFPGRAADARTPDGGVFCCPPVQELLYNGRAVARGVVDSECALDPDAQLPSRFSAVLLRSLSENAAEVPCWSWGNNTLAESFLGVISVHTLVWQTRMTGPRVVLWDRPPGRDAQKLGSAGVLKLAPPCSSLKGLSALVEEHMPALVIHDVEVSEGCLNKDYQALELLYYTDAYEYLLWPHFNSKDMYHPRTMRFLCMDAKGAHRRLSALWNARFLSAM
ncbi:hypothetical protein I4F81_009985 [Pyropia yezoensis]|nr:hypothetical protein I4F81_009985 [Neopyropia yezoensis]